MRKLQLQILLLCFAVVGMIVFYSQYQRFAAQRRVTGPPPLMDQVGDIPIVVYRPPVCKRQRVNVVYVKTHKCATSTTLRVLNRYARRNKLSVVWPTPGHYTLCYPFPFETRCFRPTKTPFNIMYFHVVFNEDVISRVMPHDSIYVTSIREPFSRMKSAFNYYSIHKRLPNLTHFAEPLVEYLRDIPKYEAMYISPEYQHYKKCMGSFSFTHNTLPFELGLPTGFHVNTTDQTNNATYIRYWIDALQRRFSLVIITEYYDESLVLLRRLMCWKLEDILYVKGNVQSYTYKDEQTDLPYVNNFKLYNQPEYILYKHFNKTLWRRITEEPDNFWNELSRFKELLSEVAEFCQKAKQGDVPLFRSSKWNEEFSITLEWCGRKKPKRKVRSTYLHNPVNDVDSSHDVPGC